MAEVFGKMQVKARWSSLFAFNTKRDGAHMLSAILTTIGAAGCKTIYAIILGRIFGAIARYGAGSVTGGDTMHQVRMWCIILTSAGFAMWFVNSGLLALWVSLGERVSKNARMQTFDTLLMKNMTWFDNQVDGLPSLMTRLQGQIRELQLATSQVLGYLITDALIGLACLVVAFVYSWHLTLVLLPTVPLSVAVLRFLSRGLEAANGLQKAELDQASKLVSAAITNIDLVKVYNGSDTEVWQYLGSLIRAKAHYLRQARGNCLQMGFLSFWMSSLFVLAFTFAAFLIDRGLSTPGDAVTTFYAVMTAFRAIESIGPQWLVLLKGMAAGQSLKCLQESQRSSQRPLDARVMISSHCMGDIKCQDISFAYPSNIALTVLQPSSFHFPAGKTTFIVGTSGSGKSTIGNLLVRFYDLTNGEITLDGRPINELDEHWLRTQVALVQQSSTSFTDTFFANIALGAIQPSDVTLEDVRKACQAVLLQSTVTALPDGLTSQLGHGGVILSGGQMQRLALARAVLRDPPVLILDEVTSGLDLVSKMLVIEAIREWRRDRTTIIITHDVSQIQDDDLVYVLDKGQQVQFGTRSILAARRNGAFASLLASREHTGLTTVSASSLASSQAREMGVAQLPQALVGGAAATEAADCSRRDSSARLSQRSDRSSIDRGASEKELMSLSDPRLDPSRAKLIRASRVLLKENALSEHSGGCAPTDDLLSEDSFARRSSMMFLAERGERSQQERPLGIKRVRSDLYGSKVNEKQHVPIPTHASARSLWQILGTVWPIIGEKDRIKLVMGIFYCAVVAACNPAFAVIFAHLLGALSAADDKLAAGRDWAIRLALVAVVDGCATFAGHYYLEQVGQAWVDSLRVDALHRVLAQHKQWFNLPSNSAVRIIDSLNSNAEEMRSLVGRFVPIIVIVTCMMLTSVTWALVVSWKLTLVVLSTGPATLILTTASGSVATRWEKKCHEGADGVFGVFSEVFINIRVVRALTLESAFSTKYETSVKKAYRLGWRRGLYVGLATGTNQALPFWVTALVFWYGTTLLTDVAQPVSLIEVVQVINLLLFSLGMAASMLSMIPQIEQAKSTAGRILDLTKLDHNAGHEHSGRLRAMTPLPISMINLQFSYPNASAKGGSSENPVLRNVNLRIVVGDCVAVVGRSGSGKTTLASLLLRLYEPPTPITSQHFSQATWASDEFSAASNLTETAVYPLKFAAEAAPLLDTAVLRSHMAYVPQRALVFPTTIRENILYGLPESSPHRSTTELRRAATAAGIDKYIDSLPDGYDTHIGDGASLTLSGGQTQRLSVARALVRHPKLLIMDEPTSALDAESAAIIRQTVRDLTSASKRASSDHEQMAIICITHSKEMMRAVDRIVVLDHGVVVEDGSYAELEKMGGSFADLVSGGVWQTQGKQSTEIDVHEDWDGKERHMGEEDDQGRTFVDREDVNQEI